jgi:hypothetical protein
MSVYKMFITNSYRLELIERSLRERPISRSVSVLYSGFSLVFHSTYL